MTIKEFVAFSPNLSTGDEYADYWLRQVTIRLRREIYWCWHERGINPNHSSLISTTIPPYTDKTTASLNLGRYWKQKNAFFKTDRTAAYLTEQLETIPIPNNKDSSRGSFGWIVENLHLDDTSSFLLALGLIVSFDNAASSVISSCLNDPQKAYPTLALAQKIWDRPEEILSAASPDHILFNMGLLHHYDDNKNGYSWIHWDSTIGVPPLVANHLLFPSAKLPALLEPMPEQGHVTTDMTNLVAAQIRSKHNSLRVVPIYGDKNSYHRGVVGGIEKDAGRRTLEFKGDPHLLQDRGYLNSVATLCWLCGVDLYLGKDLVSFLTRNNQGNDIPILPLQSIPVIIFLGITDKKQLDTIPNNVLLPVVDVPRLSYQERVEEWKKTLAEKSSGLEDVIMESSRRFRYEKESINRIGTALKKITPLTKNNFIKACRAEQKLDLGDLAQQVMPRFGEDTLILPFKQQLQFQEIITAMRSLTHVHYDWEMAKAWNEGGISVLFAGQSGTGKTMAAEILALELDLPMYRIDLSQVVNKYVGETEKNLKRLFDVADISEIILYFDEADALFGKRTEVKDAHDRFANLEINYLLERMERFKGLSILATNRKKDLDDAFMRRIRYVIDFSLPSEQQRKLIWQQSIPKQVDSSSVDLDFLARQFHLTGGNIKSVVLNACLQSAKSSSTIGKGKLAMEEIIIAIKREYEKSGRSVSPEQFGKYGYVIKRIEGHE